MKTTDSILILPFDAHVGVDGLQFTFYKFGESRVAFPRGTGEHKKLELLKAAGHDTFQAWDGVRRANDTADLHVDGDWVQASYSRFSHAGAPSCIEMIATGPDAEHLIRMAMGGM